MTTIATIAEQIRELNKAYQSGELRLTHKQYLARYNKIKNQNSVANQVKAFGAKVKREKDCIGYYIYEGVNFTAKFNQAACETTWWEVDVWSDNVDPRVESEFEEYNTFERKSDVVNALFQLDKRLNN